MSQQDYGRLYPVLTAIYGRKATPQPSSWEGHEFRKTRETLVAKQKELKKAGKGNNTKAARALTDEEVDVFCGKEHLGLLSPESF